MPKEINPKIETGFLFKIKPKNLISFIKKIRADGIGAQYSLVDEKLVKICHKNNLKINAWTVDEISEKRFCLPLRM